MVALVVRLAAARSGYASSRRLTSSGGLLAMASLVSYFSSGGPGMAAAARAPPPLFQSPLVTAEQVGVRRCSGRMSRGRKRLNEVESIISIGVRHSIPTPNPRPRQVRTKLSEGKERVKFLDASWHLDKSRNPHKEFVEEHIKGAVRFDIDKVADPASTLPHMYAERGCCNTWTRTRHNSHR